MAVRNWITSLGESIQYISPDGNTYNFHDPMLKAVIVMTGWGIPAIEKASTRGPFQHGSTPLTLRVPRRKITMTIRNQGSSRNEYWQKRTGLINALRYNRGGLNSPTPGKLRWYRSDGEIRQLDVILSSGPEFTPNRDGWDEFAYQDVITFEADNPIIYQPSQRNQTFVGFECSILASLQFPFSFGSNNIIFGGSSCNSETAIAVNYIGNWEEFPQILVSGPATNFTITHADFGWLLKLENYSIALGETVTFDLTYGKKTITNNVGDSLLGYLSTDSEIGLFSIQPDPIAPDGTNAFVVSIDDGTTDTTVLFNYYDKYIAI